MTTTPEPRQYLNDVWPLEDALGLGRTGELIAEMALQAQAPFAMRLSGGTLT